LWKTRLRIKNNLVGGKSSSTNPKQQSEHIMAERKLKWRTDHLTSRKNRTGKQDGGLEKNKMADWRTRWRTGKQDG
jgi:hypothetical protein